MEKEFFDVFPNLKVKDQLHEWLEMVTVSKVSCNPAKTRLWVYIHSERWIHKKFIFALEDQINERGLSQETIAWAAEAIREHIRPITDVRSSAQYRLQMASVLLKRGLLTLIGKEA